MSEAILDAAQRIFEQFGARRANVDDIAREAGISRSTLYRRYPTKEDLLGAVVARATDAFFDELERHAADLPPQEAVIECFVRGLALLREVPVIGRLALTEPEVITGLPGRGHLMLTQSHRIATTLRRSGATMSQAELELVSELLLRIASTYVVDPEGRLDVTDPEAVRDFAKRYLSPLVN